MISASPIEWYDVRRQHLLIAVFIKSNRDARRRVRAVTIALWMQKEEAVSRRAHAERRWWRLRRGEG